MERDSRWKDRKWEETLAEQMERGDKWKEIADEKRWHMERQCPDLVHAFIAGREKRACSELLDSNSKKKVIKSKVSGNLFVVI